jgi:hypothetical protein
MPIGRRITPMSMARILFACAGGTVSLPEPNLVLVGRRDGGNLVVNPPRDVWDRSELSSQELIHWSFLVAAAARAMIDVLPQLKDGCVNYWDAGNWALNEAAEPAGPKIGKQHRRVHLHLLGRSPEARDPAWQWGEAPLFPVFAERFAWAANFDRLGPQECKDIVARTEDLLRVRYGLNADQISSWVACPGCDYPATITTGDPGRACSECKPAV